jgi:ABC-type sugar transport system substrate-binding protein
MKKYLVPLMAIAAVITILFAGCVAPATPTAPTTPTTPTAPTTPTTPTAPTTPSEPAVDPLIPWGNDFFVKPDGTPFFVGYTHIGSFDEWPVSAEGISVSLITRAGGEITTFDPQGDIQEQIGFLEDLLSLNPPDVLELHPVQEAALNPMAETYEDAGIPVFNFDLVLPSEKVTCKVSHKFADPVIGDGLAGEFLAQEAQRLGKPLKVYFVWGQRSMEMCWDRDRGFKAVTDKYPDLITVVDSPDSDWNADIMANLVQDALTADPELNAVYVMGSMPAGVLSALRLMDRLYQIDNPDHVVLLSHDMLPTTVQGIEDGYIDATLTHMSWDLCQCLINFMFYDLVLGEDIPQEYYIPMIVVSSDNLNSAYMFGVDAVYTHYNWPEFDTWPVMDFSEIGYPIPNLAMRKELAGY